MAFYFESFCGRNDFLFFLIFLIYFHESFREGLRESFRVSKYT